jgi:hypothetical protein
MMGIVPTLTVGSGTPRPRPRLRCAIDLVLPAVALLTAAPLSSTTVEPPTVEHYSLEYRLLPERSRLEARASMTIRNTESRPVREVPLLLYRLFDVTAASDETGAPLVYREAVERMHDNERFQVNLVRVTLPEPRSDLEDRRRRRGLWRAGGSDGGAPGPVPR